ncbi:MAG: HAD-IA family hydrolase, partial [Candidatus Komeilibacteria bacterium]|nr:HAD-IA family hydrolase [Candidatus Komeilibacteria bacterium]
GVLSYLASRYMLGLITSRDMISLEKELAYGKFKTSLFYKMQSRDCHPFHKPDPRVFDLCLNTAQAAGVTREQIVYVGDTVKYDYVAAQAAGINFIGITSKYITKDMFLEAGANEDQIIDKFLDLPRAIQKLDNKLKKMMVA